MRNADHNTPTANIPLAVDLPFPVGVLAPLERPGAELDAQLDDLSQLACALCQAPVALICSRDQQGWRLSHNLGPDRQPLSFDLAFYTFAVTQRRPFEIPDLRADPAFSTSPLVSGPPHFRCFAGAPVTSLDGQLLGAICVLDTRARTLTPPQRQGLEALARQVRSNLCHQQMAAAQRVADAEARERQRQWRRVFENASIGMAEISSDGQWTQVNGAFCAILGYSVQDLLETRPENLVHPDDIPSGRAMLRKTLAGEIPSCSGEKRLLHKTGRAIWCSVHLTLVRDSSGNPGNFLAHVVDISELRQAQDGWRNAELQARALLELPVPVGILTTDAQGAITFVNRHAETLTGYSADELAGRRSIAALHLDAELREHSQRLARFFGSVTLGPQSVLEHARTSGPEVREWTWLRKDGGALRVNLTVAAIRDLHGSITGFTIAATTAGKVDGGAPGTVEGRFRTIADSAPIGMFLTDAHGNCSYVNEPFHHITGIGPADSSGQGWFAAFAPSDRSNFYNEFQKAMRRGSDFCMEVQLARPGDPAWARVRGREIFFEDVAQGYVGTLEEVTGGHLALQSLKFSEEQLRNALSSAPFPFALLDRDRKCVLASVGWLELHHRAWHDVNGRPIFDFIPEARDRLEDLCRRALNGGPPLSHEQSVRLTDDSAPESLRWHIFPCRAKGEICGVGLFAERLTPHLRAIANADAARASAEAASRIKSEFLAEVSSELRTPGSGIIGLADLLLEDEPNPARREFLEMIKTSTGAWLKLATDIHDFSKMEARKLELDILPFNLMDGLNQAMRRLAVIAENKGLDLVCQTAPDLPTVVVGDGGRLFQILAHLTAFAIDMSTAGEILISAAPGENADPNPGLPGSMEFRFTIRDSSGWLADNKLEDIQQVLMMVENSPALKKIGTNLGLVLSARLVNLMHGRLWVERAEHGAAFHVAIPLSGKPQPPIPSPLLAEVPVLIADGNPSNRRWLHQILSSWGARPTVLEKPAAILDVLEIAHEAGRPFRFALLDAHVPDRDTFAVASQMRASSRSPSATPIMLLSPSMRLADESRARELGLEHFLVKPINPNDLRDLLERALGAPPVGSPALPNAPRRLHIAKPRLNVLLIDDSRVNHEVAMGVLGTHGHRLTIARNGKEAIAILERRACDLVLLGLDMPGENSLETLAAIRQQEKEHQRPAHVFGMTADPAISSRESSLSEITDGFLPNPIQPKDLNSLLDHLGPELENR